MNEKPRPWTKERGCHATFIAFCRVGHVDSPERVEPSPGSRDPDHTRPNQRIYLRVAKAMLAQHLTAVLPDRRRARRRALRFVMNPERRRQRSVITRFRRR